MKIELKKNNKPTKEGYYIFAYVKTNEIALIWVREDDGQLLFHREGFVPSEPFPEDALWSDRIDFV